MVVTDSDGRRIFAHYIKVSLFYAHSTTAAVLKVVCPQGADHLCSNRACSRSFIKIGWQRENDYD